ncbi:septal ring factor EnvC (AmiA/AmiB activator) [Streptomyces sp. LBL]|uniref:aggregation-promoting factor C-terminal-like domain-containing protein n=1 Tax=Streptomyces sp. LBL TaxID=2940562 RepID=UPI002475AA6B|nr:peptidoglycan DD-metalloendopeptidase family protein [Streptomyces sp. LBL]MDH6625730.1 septal ring factor EnvC (AmiA/AmiB activator) [Streptomyces sp. LBL]
MADLDIVGGAAVDVVPIVPNFHTKLKTLVLPIADKVGEEAGKRMGQAMSDNIVIAIPQAINQGGKAGVRVAGKQGDDAGGAFSRSLRRKLEAAFKAMPKLDVKLGDTGVDAELARIRSKLETLSNKRVGIDVSAEAAEAEIVRLEAQLRELGAQHPNVQVRADTATARAALAEIRAEIASVGGRQDVTLEVDGAFGAKLRAVVAEAQASIPDINIDADTTPARAEVQALRERLATLSDARIGIDIDARAAMAEITAIQTRLEILSIQRTDIDVRVDAAQAAAKLAALKAMADDTKLFRITALADTSQATSALMGLGVQLAVLTAIPLGATLAAGIGAIASAAVAAGAGIGALTLAAVPAIKGVTSVMQLKTQADKEAAKATDNSASANVRAAQSALQMASAQQALTSAHRNAARSIAQSNRQVENAERAVAQAVQRAADQRRQSAENVEHAEQSLADAHRGVQRAEQSLADAHRGVQRAEQSLADAQRQSTQAQEDLTQARADAARQLADLNDQLERGKLDERDATLRVQEAQEELNRTQAEYDAGRATDLQMERAQLAYDQSVQAAKQQKKDYAQLQKDAEAAKKAGVDGNDAVKQATDRVADAQRNVQDQTQAVADAQRGVRDQTQSVADAQRNVQDQVEAVADAQRNAARAQIESAQSVADAQRSLSDVVANAANTQVQAAESIASAERGIESARLSSINTTVKAATKADEYRKALAKLTPEQRDLYDSIAGPKGLTAAFKAWSKELQPDVLPLFTRGVDGAKNSLPSLTPIVKTAADAIGDLMDRASAELKKPFWQDFKKDIEKSAKPAIVGLGIAFGNILKGMAGIVDAFLPHMDGISLTMQRITKRFADWGSNLKGSPEFERFLQYVKDTSPGVAEFLGDLMRTTLDLAQALAPMSQVAMGVVKPLLDGLSWVSNNAPGVIQILWGLYAVHKAVQLGMAAFAVAMGVYQVAIAGATLVTSGWAAAIQATGIVPVIEAIVLAVALLAAGIIWAYKNVEWFRIAVDASWGAIKKATVGLWENGLKPAFDGLSAALKVVGDIAVWLWKTAFVPAFDAISLAARIFVAVLVTLVFTPILLAGRLVGVLAMWLWTDCFKPSFENIAALAQWLWSTVLQPVFGWIWNGIKWVGDKFVWLYNNAVAPSAGWIAEKAKWLWDKALAPAFRFIWDGLRWVGEKFAWLYDHGVKPPANWIADKAAWLYDKGLRPAFDKIKTAVGLVADAFNTAKKAIGIAFGKISDIAKKPVNFIIEWVYTKGIKAVWDRVAKYVSLDPLPAAPKLLEAGGTVGNGWGPAVPMKTNKPTAIVGEGNPRYPEYVIPTDPKYRARSLALHRQAGTQLLESGGILGGFEAAWDWTKDTVSDVVGKGIDWAKAGADLLVNPSKIWNTLTKPILSKVADGVGTSPMGKALTRIPTKMVGGLKDKIVNAVSSMFSGGGAGGGQWMKPVDVPYGTKFGVAGSMWSSGHHTGLDFPAAVGTAVKAVAAGRVSMATSGGPYGNHIMIDHGGGLQSLYAHLSKIRTTVPKAQNAGDRIGDVGATGNVTGPHLHLEARLNGKPVDPMKYLTGGGGGFNANAVGAAQTYAKSILGNYGWGASQFGPLKKLWQGESGWRWNAENPSSGAFGIPQALPGSKMASAGADWRTNYRTQVRWGLGYIKNRPDYGSPASAYSKWMSRSPHWYDDGGYLQPGLNLVANGTGKPEPVFTSGQWSDVRAAKGGGTTQVHANVRVFVGDREITDIVRTEINTYDSETATDLDNGRWA